MGQANSRQEAFWDACGFGRTHLVKKFIEEGIDINWVSFTVGIVKSNKTELFACLCLHFVDPLVP